MKGAKKKVKPGTEGRVLRALAGVHLDASIRDEDSAARQLAEFASDQIDLVVRRLEGDGPIESKERDVLACTLLRAQAAMTAIEKLIAEKRGAA